MLITEGFGSYRVDLKASPLVKYKLMYVVHIFTLTEITRHPVHVQLQISVFSLNHFCHPKAVHITHPQCACESFGIR